jgi:hypothetical protein
LAAGESIMARANASIAIFQFPFSRGHANDHQFDPLAGTVFDGVAPY